MTNHAFASSQGRLTNEKLKAAVIEIVDRRFPGIFKVEGDGYLELIPNAPIKNDNHSYLSLHLCSQRMIEMRKSHLPIANWIQSVVQNELAARFKGKCSDEGLSERWVPEIRFFKYREYFNLICDHIKDDDKSILEWYWGREKRFINPAFEAAGLLE